jgi:hypothetical protein
MPWSMRLREVKMSRADMEVFHVTVTPEPGSDVPGIMRFKRWIKSALRVYGLRVVDHRAEHTTALPPVPKELDVNISEPPFAPAED